MMERYQQALADLPVLYTQRLVLRRPNHRDIPAIMAIAGDWEVASRLTRMPHPYRESDALFFLDTIVPHELTWAMVEKSSQQVIGVIGLASHDTTPATIELGYYVARPSWGQGLATEAGSAVLAYGIGLVGRDRLTSGYFIDNPASGRVLEKLGFVAVGMSDRPCLAVGAAKPCMKLALSV